MKQRIELWYASYALLGLSAAGIVPIALPLLVRQHGGVAQTGFVVAAFSMGGLTAPLWGGLADRFRLHRWVLAGGLVATAAGSFLCAAALSAVASAGSAFLAGAGLAAAATVANLFVIEVHPREEWDSRIGWLQTFYGGGQVAGLAIAGRIAGTDPAKGLWLAGAVSLAAVVPALVGTRRPDVPSGRPVLPRHVHHTEWPVGSPQHHYHRPTLAGFKNAFAAMSRPFGRFLIAWLLSFSGVAALFSLYPVLMHGAYGVMPAASSAGYAAAAGLGLFLYAPAGAWSGRRGPGAVLRGALLLRLVALAALAILATTAVSGKGPLAVLCFAVVVLAWSLLSVASAALVAKLSQDSEGEAMGVFNAVTALAGVIGAALGGWLAGEWGPAAVPVMGMAGVVAGFLLIPLKETAEKQGGGGEA